MATLEVLDKYWNANLKVPNCVLSTIYFSIASNFEQPGNESQTSTLCDVLKDVCGNRETVKNGDTTFEIKEDNVKQLVNEAKTHESEMNRYTLAVQNRNLEDGVKFFNKEVMALHTLKLRESDGGVSDEFTYPSLNAFGNHVWGILKSNSQKRIAAQQEQERA